MNIKQFFKSMLSDSDGAVSSQRFIVLITGLVILIMYSAQNIMAMIGSKGHIDFMPNEVILMGTVLAAKVIQSFSEKKAGQ
jgi:hypothetical protein